ncbi:aminoglycoside phosphotransferase family protein [Streptomyces sp. NBC_01471]|uniref:aminoglycoside phosphotransferase family protein n=1 Tax=Streptomyces sp. NBC_01471 TaxID=2903879 RepID=UPI003244D14B
MVTTEQDPGNRARLITRFGPSAGPWYDALPALVDVLARRWGLDVGAAGGGGTSRVYRCLRYGEGDTAAASVWLKLTPDPVIASQEAEALNAWSAAPSVVRLLESDLGAGALLLAGVEPGTRVREHGWGTADIARLLADLRAAPRPRTPLLPPLSDRIAFMYDMAARRGTHGPQVLARGRAAALELAGTGPADGLVHGDLHQGNVLVGPAGRLVAIDPRPTNGDPDFDAADWAVDGVTDEAGLRRRIAALAPLVPGMSADRVLGWCRATAPLTTGAPAFLVHPRAPRG